MRESTCMRGKRKKKSPSRLIFHLNPDRIRLNYYVAGRKVASSPYFVQALELRLNLIPSTKNKRKVVVAP